MHHEPEFHTPTIKDTDSKARDMAACYARVFLGSEDGKRVLADLRAKFGLHRLVFIADGRGGFNNTRATLTEGERRVLSEIEGALQLGASSLNPLKQNQQTNHE